MKPKFGSKMIILQSLFLIKNFPQLLHFSLVNGHMNLYNSSTRSRFIVWFCLWHINPCRLFNAKSFIYTYCREEENLVFWFGAQFISTLNFNQSGWLILFSPDLHFRPLKLVSRQTQSLWLGNADQSRHPSGRS